MDKRIKGLDIKCFRGIPNQLSIDFTNPKGYALSSIIYGENGSGKSSIIDALEFVLQGKIERSDKLRNPLRPSTSNYISKDPQGSSVTVLFEDETQFTREIVVEWAKDNINFSFSRRPFPALPEFKLVPTTLRRNDIIAYNYIEEAKRQVLLMSFIYNAKESKQLKTETDPDIVRAKQELYEQKNKRKEAIEDILSFGFFEEQQILSTMHSYEQLYRYITNRIGPYYKKINKNVVRVPIPQFERIIGIAREITDASDRISFLNKEIKSKTAIKSMTMNNGGQFFQNVSIVLREASDFLFDAFKKITNIDYINDISLSVGNLTVASLDIKLTLNSGVVISPNKIFSEANYDLLVLLLYISIIRVGVKNGQAKILVLDDVLQSVDSVIRSKFINYLLENMGEWQFFITCHDRLWLNHLKYLFNLKGHQFKELHITRWDFHHGPVLEEKRFEKRDTSIDDAIKTSNIRIIAATTGFFFEKICQKLSVSLPTSVKRNEGDRYTIGDLWPNIRKALKNTNIEPTLKLIDELLLIRNLLGCHYNEWADALSDREVHDFANAVKNLYDTVFCDKCFSWVSLGGAKPTIAECRCRSLQITK